VFKRFVLVLILIIVAAGLLAAWGRQRLVTPYRGFAGEEVFVELPPGASVGAIANRLVVAGVIPDAWTFRLQARVSGADRRLRAGEYRFADDASPREVMDRLIAGDVFTRPITIPEGLTIAEMGALVAKAGVGTAADFVRAGADTALISAFDPDARSLEGYLFPSTYALPRSVGGAALVRLMVAGFDRAFDETLRAEAAARGLTPRDVVTLASLIEKETARADERAIVSGVYHNRLRIGMPLQCDPTVIYALMLAGKWNGNLRRVDLQMASPYNTYTVRGLPPGPIASPGRASLEAAVRPADVPYFYFVSRNDGSHVFATTLAEHNRNVAQWQRRGRE
jgi:UPF0755 protein